MQTSLPVANFLTAPKNPAAAVKASGAAPTTNTPEHHSSSFKQSLRSAVQKAEADAAPVEVVPQGETVLAQSATLADQEQPASTLMPAFAPGFIHLSGLRLPSAGVLATAEVTAESLPVLSQLAGLAAQAAETQIAAAGLTMTSAIDGSESPIELAPEYFVADDALLNNLDLTAIAIAARVDSDRASLTTAMASATAASTPSGMASALPQQSVLTSLFPAAEDTVVSLSPTAYGAPAEWMPVKMANSAAGGKSLPLWLQAESAVMSPPAPTLDLAKSLAEMAPNGLANAVPATQLKILSGDFKTLLIEGADGLSVVTDSVPSTGKEAAGWSSTFSALGALSPSLPAVNFEGRVSVPVTVAFGHAQWSNNLAERTAWLVGQSLQTAEIQLDPPELGPLQVKIHLHQDQASVSFVSLNPQVRDAVEQTVGRLRDLLQEQGLELVDAGVGEQHAGQQQEAGDGEGHSGLSEGGKPAAEAELQTLVMAMPWSVDFYA